MAHAGAMLRFGATRHESVEAVPAGLWYWRDAGRSAMTGRRDESDAGGVGGPGGSRSAGGGGIPSRGNPVSAPGIQECD